MGQGLLNVPQPGKELSSFSGVCSFIFWSPQEPRNVHKPSVHPHCLGLEKQQSQSEAGNNLLYMAEEGLEEDGGTHSGILGQCNHGTRHADFRKARWLSRWPQKVTISCPASTTSPAPLSSRRAQEMDWTIILNLLFPSLAFVYSSLVLSLPFPMATQSLLSS